MHTKEKGFIFKGEEDTRANLIGDGDQIGDAKRDESLVSMVSQSEIFEIDETRGYITQRFQKLVSEHGGSRKKETHDNTISSGNVCYRTDQPVHSMRDCLIHGDDFKEVETNRGTRSILR